MLSFNRKDYNIPAIAIESKMGNFDTKFEYRLFGLKQEENPLILIYNPFIGEIQKPLLELKKFFKKNNLQLEIENTDVRRISIGLRYDIRANIILCSSILQTIIYTLENRLALDQKYKLPGIPSFEKGKKKKRDEIIAQTSRARRTVMHNGSPVLASENRQYSEAQLESFRINYMEGCGCSGCQAVEAERSLTVPA